MRVLIIALTALLTVASAHGETPRSRDAVQRERAATNKRIAATQQKISDNDRRTRRSLDDLNALKSKIATQRSDIAALQRNLDTLALRIARVNDSIATSEAKIATLRKGMAESLRAMRSQRQRMNALTFVFSASSFSEAMRRIGYLTQLNTWRDSKVKNISGELQHLKDQRTVLATLTEQQNRARAEMTAAMQVLDTRRGEADAMVVKLRAEGSTLQKMLAADRKKAANLDRELDRIIAAEAERERREREAAAARKSQQKQKTDKPAKNSASTPSKTSTPPAPKGNGSFASQRGHLPMPVAGNYRIIGTFGRNQHSDLSNIEVDNSGIDISASAGTAVRAVADGTVSSIFEIEGYDTVVIVRHGSYLTVYAGITGVSVAKGASVKAGQGLGRLHTDAAGRSVLHFEVRNERQKLNPLDWLAR